MLKREEPGALLQAAPFPHRLAGAGHSDGQESGAGSGALLREAAQDGFRHRVPRRRRRAGRGLRRQRARRSTARRITRLQEYTNDIVYYIADVCNAEKVPHPDIVSESGRAIVAHHSVLIVEVFGAIEKSPAGHPVRLRRERTSASCSEMLDIRKNLAKLNKLEAFHDAQERREDAHHMFTLGLMELPDKAKIETLYWEIAPGRRRKLSRARPTSPRKSASSKTASATNTSAIFPCSNRCSITGRSGSSFPIMPLSRLERTPDARGHAGGHHVRFRRPDQQVHRPARRARHAAAARAATERQRPGALLPRLLSHGRLPGHHGRPAQPLRPRERGARLPRSGRSRRATTSRKSSKATRSCRRSRRCNTTRTNWRGR